MKNNVLRRVICFFFSFILSLSLFIISVSFSMHQSLLNKDFLLNELSISGYHIEAAEYTKNSISDLAFTGGVPSDIFDDIVTSERVKTDIYNIFDYAYDGNRYSIDSEQLKSEFLNAITSYASDNGIELDEETEESISHLAELCTETYMDCINISGMNTVIGSLKQPVSFMRYVIAGAALIALISVVMLFLVNRYKHKFFRYTAFSVSGSLLMLLAVPGYFLAAKPYAKLNISPDYLHTFINCLLNDTLKTVLAGAAVMAVIYIILLFLISIFKKRAIKKGINERHKNSFV